MHCEQAETLLAGMVFSELDGPQKAALLEHLASCAKCSALVEESRSAAGALKEALEAERPRLRPERKAALLKAVAADCPGAGCAVQAPPAKPPGKAPSIWRRQFLTSLSSPWYGYAAAAAIVIFLLSMTMSSFSGSGGGTKCAEDVSLVGGALHDRVGTSTGGGYTTTDVGADWDSDTSAAWADGSASRHLRDIAKGGERLELPDSAARPAAPKPGQPDGYLGDDSLPRKSEQHGETAAEQTVSGKGTVGKLALGSPSRVLNMPVKPPATTAPNLPPPPAPAREPVAGPSAGEGGIVVAKGMPTPSVTARPSLKPPPDLAAKKAPVRLPESKAKATSPLPAKAPAVKPPPAKRGGLVGLLTREHNYSSMEAPPGYQLKDELKAADKIDAKDARQKEDSGRLDFEYAQKQQADQPAENLERQHSQAEPEKKLGTGLTQAKSNVGVQRPDDSARSVDLPADEAKDADNELFKTVTTHGGRARPEGVEGKSAAKDEQPAFIRVPAQQSLSYYDVSDVTHEIRDFQGDLQKPEDRPAEQQKAAVAAEQPAPKPATEGEKESGESAQQGGPNTIQYRNGKLIVSHNPEVKEQITKLLEDRKGTQTEDESTESDKAQTELQITQEAIEAPVFKAVPVNPFVLTEKDRFSTFALDVDTASYYLARRYILDGRLPPPPAVRMEEFVNAFDYNYPRSSQGVFTVQAEGMPSPFRPGLALLKIGVQGRALGRDGRRPTHFVFVVDASGSMARADRMPLVQHGLMMLTEQLGAADRFTLVTFGSGADLVLEAAPGSEKQQIRNAIAALRCGGSTNLLDGVLRGYEAALRKFRAGEINRVVLLSDGAANIGVTEADDMLAKVDTYRKHGITFTSVGFGTGSYNDEVLEKLSNKGDGTYTFVSSREEAALVLGVQMATLQVIAKDAKIQVEFSPEAVRRYRLIGYENRDVADKDFRNDAIDAGEVACGQSSTALYEMELADAAEAHGDIGTVYVRYRNAETSKVEEISTRLERPLIAPRTAAEAPRLYLAAAVAEFAEILRGSEHVAGSNVANVKNVLVGAANELPLDQRVADLLRVVERSGGLPVAQWQQ